MSESPRNPEPGAQPRRRDHLRLVAQPSPFDEVAAAAAAVRPRSIGRLIAQTALIADSATTRRRHEREATPPVRSMAGRLLGRFR